MTDDFSTSDLWRPRSVAETRKIYADWADTYDRDVIGAGYATPGRIAGVLAEAVPDRTTPILDYGCGTGLSGLALRSAGFSVIDGTDISAEMLSHAEARGIYRHLWQTDPTGDAAIGKGRYPVVAATGVVSLGAAPPETLAQLLDGLDPGGLLVLSYNDATLADARYMEALTDATSGAARVLRECYGDHLPEKDMKSKIYLLEKT